LTKNLRKIAKFYTHGSRIVAKNIVGCLKFSNFIFILYPNLVNILLDHHHLGDISKLTQKKTQCSAPEPCVFLPPIFFDIKNLAKFNKKLVEFYTRIFFPPISLSKNGGISGEKIGVSGYMNQAARLEVHCNRYRYAVRAIPSL
jgi:hypothetical protein